MTAPPHATALRERLLNALFPKISGWFESAEPANAFTAVLADAALAAIQAPKIPKGRWFVVMPPANGRITLDTGQPDYSPDDADAIAQALIAAAAHARSAG